MIDLDSKVQKMHTAPALLPCPFCGAPAFLWRTFKQVIIECSKYHADTHRIMVSGDTDDEAVERWNARSDGQTV